MGWNNTLYNETPEMKKLYKDNNIFSKDNCRVRTD
jgi:hypothetical protein